MPNVPVYPMFIGPNGAKFIIPAIGFNKSDADIFDRTASRATALTIALITGHQYSGEMYEVSNDTPVIPSILAIGNNPVKVLIVGGTEYDEIVANALAQKHVEEVNTNVEQVPTE